MKKGILKAIPAILVLPVIFVAAVYFGVFGHLQTREELVNYRNATATRVLSSDGKLIGRIFYENRTNVSFDQVPSSLVNALISTEDSRFYRHSGIDVRSLARVFFKSLLLGNREAGGGSTITQQLAKNMYGRAHTGSFSILISKTREAILALRLEKTFTKEEILALYLNTVSFGQNVYGIETASLMFFNKEVKSLKVEESAVLIGMLKANTMYNPRLHPENAFARRNIVLRQMEKYRYISESQADSLSALPLKLDYSDIIADGPADYFLVRVKQEAEGILDDIAREDGKEWNIEEDGLIITTTLNLTLQNYALESFHEHLPVMQKKLLNQYSTPAGKRELNSITEQVLKDPELQRRAGEVNLRRVFGWNGSRTESISVTDSIKQALLILHAGLIALDPLTGSVIAWIGGIDFRSLPYDQIYARRQMASVFKPILYAEALETGMDPCYYLDNDSIVVSTESGDWSPSNYDHSTGGKYSLAGALALSMNIPTYNLFTQVGFDNLDTLWRKLGFSFRLVNNPSLALGTAEASILETALAYSVFANGGYTIAPRSVLSIRTPDGKLIYTYEGRTTGERILSERSANLVKAILEKAVSEGTGSSLGRIYGITMPMAGKTGTSQDYADAWFASFNSRLVMVARAGASTRAIHFNNGSFGSGSALALPLVALTLRKMQDNDTLCRQFGSAIGGLPPELNGLLDCPDYREGNLFDRFRGLLHRKKIAADTTGKKTKKKKGFLYRLFGK